MRAGSATEAGRRVSQAPLNLTYDDLEVPQNLSHAERMGVYARSKLPLQRLVCASLITRDAVLAWDAVLVLADDVVWAVREAVAGKLDVYLLRRERAQDALKLCGKLARDENELVRAAAIGALGRAGDAIPNALAELTTLALATSRSLDAGVRLSSVPLCGATLGKLDIHAAVALLSALQHDVHFAIRKQATVALGKLAPCLVDAALANRAFASLPALAQNTAWPVRKAAADAFGPAAANAHVKASIVDALHSAAMHMAVQDHNRWVRLAAYASLGPLIAALRPGAKDDALLAAFADVDLEVEQMRYLFAYNLPGVLQASPDARWARLRAGFLRLVPDGAVSVRRSLASSMGVVAGMLSEANVEKDVAPSLVALLLSEDDDHAAIRVAAVGQAAAVMARLPLAKRAHVFSAVVQLRHRCLLPATPCRDVRLAIAEQLSRLAEVRPPLLVDETMALCQDDVYAVRAAACAALGTVLGDAGAMEQFQGINLLCTWAHDAKYLGRQVFGMACTSCLAHDACRAAAGAKLVPLLKSLAANDAVLAVKAAAQDALSNGVF